MNRLAFASIVLITGSLDCNAQAPKTIAPPSRVLPGLQHDGFVQLPNLWKLKPTGSQIDVGDFPVNIQFHPSGQFAAVLHNGYREHEVILISLENTGRKIVSRTIIPQSFTGLVFSPDGKQLYASGGEFDRVHVWDFDKGLLHNARTISIEQEDRRMVAGGIALDAAGKDLFVTAVWSDAVVRVPLVNPDNRTVIRMTAKLTKPEKPQGDPPSPPDGRRKTEAPAAGQLDKSPIKDNSYPYTCLVEPNGKRLFVSLWANAKIAVVDLETNTIVDGWQTAEHPTELALSPDAKTLYVSCANSTKVSVFDIATGRPIQTIHCGLYPQAPSGNTPNSLCLTPDGQMLFVANADANNLAVFNVSDPKAAKPLGFIPTGWYPTSVRYHAKEKMIYVANGKGRASKPNPSGAVPENPRSTIEYIGSLFSGTVSTTPLPSPEDMARYSKTAFECSPLKADLQAPATVSPDNPIPDKLGKKSPIKHCIYIVKENRTYDQVFGDIKQGNGEPTLCLFPDRVTPNHHKLAQEFVLLDNIYVEGEVSADGHEWSMGAYATDFVEKMWPLSYRGSPKGTFGYPSEGQMDTIARPAGGYIWDRCKTAGVSYRSYGEWIENGKKNPDGTFEDSRATVKALEGRFDPKFRGYDLDYTDVQRAQRFIEELKQFEREGGFPQMTILRLPNDHTAGTRIGKPTPTAMVADNDLALGMVVDAISHSKFWKETAIFVIEDDAQNGPDHVDSHRVVALVISPYTKRKYVDSTMYSTSSMLRTMELILGLQPMSQFDAAARPMYNSFTSKADITPYQHAPAQVDLKATNQPGVFGAELSEKMDLAKEDRADDILFNEVIWKSVRGAHSRMPAPIRAAFFVPIKAKKDHDDDD